MDPRDVRLAQAATRRRVAMALLIGAAATPVSSIDNGRVLCPVRRAFGRPCPGCGMTRSVVRTVHGAPGAAVRDHAGGPLLVAGLALWALTGSRHAGTLADPQQWTTTPTRRTVLGVLTVAWLVWAGRRAMAAPRR